MRTANPQLDSGPMTYQIRVQGRLDAHWSEWFDGMAIQLDKQETTLPTTTLTGVVDQSALHGILARIHDLNLKLLSVTQLGQAPDVEEGESNGKTAENGVA